MNLKESSIIEILDDINKKNLEKYYNYIDKNNINLIYFYEAEYPAKLKNIEN